MKELRKYGTQNEKTDDDDDDDEEEEEEEGVQSLIPQIQYRQILYYKKGGQTILFAFFFFPYFGPYNLT